MFEMKKKVDLWLLLTYRADGFERIWSIVGYF